MHTVADLKTYGSAQRHFVELWGGPRILNRWLGLTCVALVVVIGILGHALVQANYELANRKPIVIRIDAIGRAEAVAYDEATWKPQIPELRYFLTQFTVKHYSRMRATIARDYPASLLFLDGAQTNALLMSGGNAAELFLQKPSAEEVDVEVKNVTFSDLSTPPYRASIDFVRHSYAPNSRDPRKSEAATAQVAFVLRTLPNAFVPVNPLGLQITQLRVDEAFDSTR